MPNTNPNRYPMITWGAGFANTLAFGDVFDQALAWTAPREGYKAVQSYGTGEEDAWMQGRDGFLSGALRLIPLVTTATRTGWDGPTGVKAWLAWARAGQVFRWYPDATVSSSYYEMFLVEPTKGPAETEPNGDKKLALTMRCRYGEAVVEY